MRYVALLIEVGDFPAPNVLQPHLASSLGEENCEQALRAVHMAVLNGESPPQPLSGAAAKVIIARLGDGASCAMVSFRTEEP